MSLVRNLLILGVCLFSALGVATESEEMMIRFHIRAGNSYLEQARSYRLAMPSYYRVTRSDGYFGLKLMDRDRERLAYYHRRANAEFQAASDIRFLIARRALNEAVAKEYARRLHLTVTLSPSLEDARLIVNGHIMAAEKGATRKVELLTEAGKSQDTTIAIEIVRQGTRYTSVVKTAKQVKAGAAPTYVSFTELDFQTED